jgi:hypothetical protein
LDDFLESGYITQEEYDADKAKADNLYSVPGPETIPYKLNGNKLTLVIPGIGSVVLTRR